MQTKEILSTNNSKQTKAQSCPETSAANSRFVRAKGGFLREVMCLTRKKKGKSKALSGQFCLRYSEAEQTALQFLHIYCSNVNSCSSAPESNKQNRRGSTSDLSFLFCYKHQIYLKTFLRLHQARLCRTGFRANLPRYLFLITG